MNCRMLRISGRRSSASRTTIRFSSSVPLYGYGCARTYVLSSGDCTRPMRRAFFRSLPAVRPSMFAYCAMSFVVGYL